MDYLPGYGPNGNQDDQASRDVSSEEQELDRRRRERQTAFAIRDYGCINCHQMISGHPLPKEQPCPKCGKPNGIRIVPQHLLEESRAIYGDDRVLSENEPWPTPPPTEPEAPHKRSLRFIFVAIWLPASLLLYVTEHLAGVRDGTNLSAAIGWGGGIAVGLMGVMFWSRRRRSTV